MTGMRILTLVLSVFALIVSVSACSFTMCHPYQFTKSVCEAISPGGAIPPPPHGFP
jgi:hypothetical protein